MKDLQAVYARRSDKTETEESVDRQVHDGIEDAKKRGLTPVVFREPKGIRSGYYEKHRPEWLRLKRELESNPRYAVLWVADLARASRNRNTTLSFVDWLQSKKIEFISQKENIDPTTAAGRALLGVIAVFNQFYRDDISERKLRQHRSRDKSIYASNVHPFGLTRTGHYPNITWTPTADFPAIILIAELYVSGYGTPAIAKELNTRGVRWISRTKERVQVSPHAVEKAIRAFERYKDFLDPNLYAQFLRHRESQRHTHTRTRHNKHEPFLLTGLLYCQHCGSRFHSSTDTSRRVYGEYVYKRYQHRNAMCGEGTYSRRLDIIESQVWDKLEWLNHLEPEHIEQIAHRASDTPQTQALDVKLKRDKLLERLRGYEEMRADKEITRERWLEVKQDIEQELLTIPEQVPVRDTGQPVTYEQMYAVLGAYVEQFKKLREAQPTLVNTIFRTFIHRILFDGDRVTEVILREPFTLLERMSEPSRL